MENKLFKNVENENYSKVKLNILNKLVKENNYLLDICNKIELYFIISNKDYMKKDFENFIYPHTFNNKNLSYMENIHHLNENSFKFYLEIKRCKFSDYKGFKQILLKENEYLKDIIKFYSVFIHKNNKKLLKEIKDLNLNEQINNINMFYTKL